MWAEEREERAVARAQQHRVEFQVPGGAAAEPSAGVASNSRSRLSLASSLYRPPVVRQSFSNSPWEGVHPR